MPAKALVALAAGSATWRIYLVAHIRYHNELLEGDETGIPDHKLALRKHAPQVTRQFRRLRCQVGGFGCGGRDVAADCQNMLPGDFVPC